MTGFDDRARVMVATFTAVRMVARTLLHICSASSPHLSHTNGGENNRVRRVWRVANYEKNWTRGSNLELGNLVDVCIEIGKLVYSHVGCLSSMCGRGWTKTQTAQTAQTIGETRMATTVLMSLRASVLVRVRMDFLLRRQGPGHVCHDQGSWVARMVAQETWTEVLWLQ